MSREGDGFLRSFFSRAFYKISKKLTHMDMSDGHGDFRMMSRAMADAILEMKEYNRYMKGLFSFVGFNTKWIAYEGVERAAGCTKWSFKSLFAYAFEGILSFSTAPLKLAGFIGLLLFFAGIVFMGWNLAEYLWLGRVVGSMDVLLFAILMLGSLQMLFIYILGAYLSRDYLENKKRTGLHRKRERLTGLPVRAVLPARPDFPQDCGRRGLCRNSNAARFRGEDSFLYMEKLCGEYRPYSVSSAEYLHPNPKAHRELPAAGFFGVRSCRRTD